MVKEDGNWKRAAVVATLITGAARPGTYQSERTGSAPDPRRRESRHGGAAGLALIRRCWKPRLRC
jgi:hypothetical protein